MAERRGFGSSRVGLVALLSGVGAAAGCGVKAKGPDEVPYIEVYETAQFGDLLHDYGTALLLVDVDQDGDLELVAGSPSRDGGDGVVLLVDLASLTVEQLLVPWRPLGDTSANHHRFGASLAHGDWNGDGRLDLAVGDPAADVGAVVEAGEVWVFFGPLDAAVATRLSSSAADSSARFGATLAAGDFDDDGFADLAVGAPRPAELTAAADPNSVEVFYGPDFTRSERWDAQSAGGEFGAALVALPRADGGTALVAGAPEWDASVVARGGFFAWERFVDATARTVAADDPREQGLGRAGACGDFDGDGDEELLVAAFGGGDSVALYRADTLARQRRRSLPAPLAGRAGAPVVTLPDVSRDGAAELMLLAASAEERVALLFSPGRGASHLLLDRAGAAVVAGDLDGDGDLEYLVSRPTALQEGGGLSDLTVVDFTWTRVQQLAAARRPSAVIPGIGDLRTD